MSAGYVGFNKLRQGRIHLICPRCGRKQSNAPREQYDPPTAALVSIFCEKCSAGSKDSGATFRDEKGRQLCSYCGRWACERAGGTRECDERLIVPAPDPQAGKGE